MNTEEVLRTKPITINDYSSQVFIMEIPTGIAKEKNHIFEIRRSYNHDNAFIIIEDGVWKVVDQCDIWETIKDISERLFKAFGIYKPIIIWQKELEDLIQKRMEIEAGKKSLGTLFG